MAPRDRDPRRGRDAARGSRAARGRGRRAAARRAAETRAAETRAAEDRAAQDRAAETRAAERRTAEGRAGEGRAAEGRAPGREAAGRGARTTGGRPGAGSARGADRRSAAHEGRSTARPQPRRPQSRARTRAGAGTGGAFGMSGTRRAALLAMVVCALALSIAVPLRTYLAQREELREVNASHETLRAEVGRLEERKRELADPAHLEAEARRRLHYVRPGETPYVVQLPGDAERELEERRPATQPAEDKAWYEQLWDSAAAR
ncbi:septum formation initiator family protein [Saccharothrix xinjiangensis]|uniref:FtsB family cell division protein n=1 Tax=Saccharothrix xinjiangensis TaxID=204798 RepID=UPI0031D9EA79